MERRDQGLDVPVLDRAVLRRLRRVQAFVFATESSAQAAANLREQNVHRTLCPVGFASAYPGMHHVAPALISA